MSSEVPAGGPFKAALGMHEPLTIEHLKEARRQLSYYCLAEKRFCAEYVKRVKEISLNVASARLEDLAGGEGYAGIDKDLISILGELAGFYADYLSGLLALHGEEVAVIAVAGFEAKGIRLRRGEATVLPPGAAARLTLAGMAKPVKSNAINLRLI